jgi:hypothetical protein
MDKAAVETSSVSLTKTIASAEAMRTAKTFMEFDAAWSDFLVAAHRIFSKLEQGAKISEKSKTWYEDQRHERLTDPLLAYIHRARNADEHGIERITEVKPGGIGIGSKGSTHIKRLVIGGGRIEGETSGDPLVITITPTSARLIAVTDRRGNVYNPPTEHQGIHLEDTSPLAIAELAISHMRNMIADARKLL